MKNKPIIAAVLIMVAVWLMPAGRAGAAGRSLDGLTVSPAFQQVTIQSGADQTPIDFKITNNRPTAQALTFSVSDFNTLNESGGLFFVGTNPTALQKKYGLARWVSLTTDKLVLQPKQTYDLKASILNLPSLAPGGHYGALMISLADGQPSPKQQVGLQPIASSLLFVTKPQGATHQLSLSDVYFSHSLISLPRKVTLRFQNTGNTHVVPRGEVTLKAPDGKPVSKGVINPDSNIILPQTYRRYQVDLQRLAGSGSHGRYSLRVDFRFDGIDGFRSYQSSFWYLEPAILWFIALIVLAAVALAAVRFKKKGKAAPKNSSAQ